VQDPEGWSEELRTAHLELSAADLKFRDFARQDDSLRRRTTFHLLDGDRRLQYRQQPWPTFLGGAKLEQLKDLSLALAALIRSVPQRIFQDDAAKICEFYRLPSPAAAEIVLAKPNCIEDSMARGDLIDTIDGFKCLEFNFTPNVGGWETSFVAGLQRKIPQLSSFLERERISCSYTSTLQALFQHVLPLAERWRLCEQGEVNVACAFAAAGLEDPGLRGAMELFQRELDQSCQLEGKGRKGKVIACHYGQLIPVQGSLYCERTPVHAVLELCLELAPAGVYRCFKAGKVLLFNGPISIVLSDKRNLALLSQSHDSDRFSQGERYIIRRHIPWTRLVSIQTVKFRGHEVFLPDLLTAERESLVLKEGRNYGGKGVYLGCFTAPGAWEEVARTALEKGGWVVQERLESRPYLFQCGDHGCAPHDVIWGPFVFGSTYGGVILRMQPKAAGGAVNLSIAATEGIVLEVEEQTAAHAQAAR
jgi:hypothetical protein